MASLMADESTVTRIGAGVYRVVGHDGRREIVYVAGPSDDRWAFWNGQVFHGDFSGRASREPRGARAHSTQSLTAPMPATVLKVQVKPGDTVKKGDIVVVLEAMKMELPIRAPGDGVVATVSCREGELVQADAMLVALA
jgi:acetyl/propionyl-CoA carboxylase alpha subunit